MWRWLLQRQQQQPKSPTINVNVDLSAIRDLFEKKGFIKGGEEPEEEPTKVNVMNQPIAYPS
jgi:hypothetical protein